VTGPAARAELPYAAAVPRTVVLIYAHPYPDRSRANRVLLSAVRDMAGLEVRSLYDLYPDLSIDVEAERAALVRADVVVWQSPFYWYGMPALLHLWIEKVLGHGWAYGEGGTSLHGKTAFWATTTGAPLSEYAPGHMHGHPFEAFTPVVSQTARFCGMHWASPPLALHSAHRVSDAELHAVARRYRERLEHLVAAPHHEDAPARQADA
jgi:glutathione-regulated potassium-efflux system ancillary protein KefF